MRYLYGYSTRLTVYICIWPICNNPNDGGGRGGGDDGGDGGGDGDGDGGGGDDDGGDDRTHDQTGKFLFRIYPF